ncbi:MAG: hypothetical protein V2A34_05315, partial [Lentisphaerota bacterium]
INQLIAIFDGHVLFLFFCRTGWAQQGCPSPPRHGKGAFSSWVASISEITLLGQSTTAPAQPVHIYDTTPALLFMKIV